MHKKVYKFIDSNKNQGLKLLKDLVAIPSINPHGEGYAKVVARLERECRKLGLKTKRIPVPARILKEHRVDTKHKRICLLADWNVGASKTLHVNGHYDVVPCSKNWSSDPFKPVIKYNRIYGRGTEDMKSNIATYLMAVFALKKNNLKPKCNLQFSFTPDEETGGETGFGYLVRSRKINPDYGIGEGYSGNYLSFGNKGVIWFKVEAKGMPGHASKPYKGVNAFEGMVTTAKEFIKLKKKISKRRTALATKNKEDRSSTMVLGGWLWGGGKTNVIPGASGFSIDRRFLPEENVKSVKKEIYDCAENVMKRNKNLNIKVTTLVEQNCTVCDFKNKFSKSFSSAIKRVLDKKAKFAIMAGATDMRFLMAKGIPCIGYSVDGGGRCHADDEYVTTKSIVDTTKIFADIFLNFKG